MASPFLSKNLTRDHLSLSFAELLIDHLVEKVSARVDRELSLHLTQCDYVDRAGYGCEEFGTVHLVFTEEDLCQQHFTRRLKEVTRGN